MKEEWKPIPGYENFLVSNTGRVKRLPYVYVNAKGHTVHKPEKEVTTSINKKGYMRAELCIGNGKKKPFTVHRLVMYAFRGSPPLGMDQINHKDGDKTNNHPDNLEWSNNSHNIKHAWRTGLFKPNLPSGLQSPHAKLLVHSEYGVFSNILEVAAETGIGRGRIAKMITNKITNTTKYLMT